MAERRHRDASAHSTALSLVERDVGSLWQIAGWPEAHEPLTARLSTLVDGERVDRPNRIVRAAGVALWYVAPTTWWWQPEAGTDPRPSPFGELDGRAAITALGVGLREIDVRGDAAAELLARHVPVRLDSRGLSLDTFARTDIHHVSITVRRHASGYSLWVPRSFSVSLRALLDETAAQFVRTTGRARTGRI